MKVVYLCRVCRAHSRIEITCRAREDRLLSTDAIMYYGIPSLRHPGVYKNRKSCSYVEQFTAMMPALVLQI